MRLLTHSAMAREVGCSQQSVSRAVKEGCPLYDALVGKKVDIESECAIKWIDDRERKSRIKRQLKKPRPKPKPKPKPAVEVIEEPAQQDLEKYESGEGDIRTMADMTLDFLVNKFGTAERFFGWVKALHEIEKTHERRIKNLEKLKDLVSRRIIKQGIIDPIEECLTKLLTDGAKTMAIDCHAKALAGRSVEDLEEYIRKTMGKFIRPSKERMARTLASFKGE